MVEYNAKLYESNDNYFLFACSINSILCACYGKEVEKVSTVLSLIQLQSLSRTCACL